MEKNRVANPEKNFHIGYDSAKLLHFLNKSHRDLLPIPKTVCKGLFFCPLGILLHYIQCGRFNPEPRTRPYEIRIYLHGSLLKALNCLSVLAYKTPNSCGEGLLEPGPAQWTLTELHCWY